MTLRILDPGLFTLVVDAGRPGGRALGVPPGGAADRAALALGNALVGNPPNAAALEICLAGPSLQADCPLACVVHGAPFLLTCGRRRLKVGTTFTLPPGEELHIGSTATGMRAYFCVAGGFDVPVILDSRSGLAPLTAGAELPCRPGRIHGRFVAPLPHDGQPGVLRVLPGPQADWFDANEFYPQEFTVTPASNRMGLRLKGQPLTWPQRELVSEPVCPGSVQVTRDGQCIVMGVDGQTIGGYPKIAQVIRADLDQLGQLRPHARVRFVPVGIEEAQRLYRARQTTLRRWVVRLHTSLTGWKTAPFACGFA